MKKVYLLFVMLASGIFVYAQTIITYGNNTVSKEEFLRAFNKNNTSTIDREKPLREYLTLYSNFKLKVKAAEELRLDTLPQIQYDIENFRRQVEENYLSDEKGVAKLMEEAFVRSQKDLHLVHFSVSIDPQATAEDTIRAYRNLLATATSLGTGNDNYQSIAETNKVKFGDLGYITVFSLPYAYENIAYELKTGQVSKPYRSKNAWHLFKLLDTRKSIGKWKVAQILFTYPPDADENSKKSIQRKADSVYRGIKSGKDFASAAKEFSDDKLTYLTGGELPEFGTGKFDSEFEKEVFKLKQDGDISSPFSTQFGIHIVKRIGFTETATERENAALQFELKQKISQDSRINNAKEKFAADILSIIGYKKTLLVKEVDLYRYADTVSKDLSMDNVKQYPISNKKIITFKSGSLSGADWLNFVKEYKSNKDQYKGESNPGLWEKFVTISTLNYYRKHLEEFNIDFKYQMKEFKEGNMLFEIMERNVWSKAATDSAGLITYYNANKSNYKWAESADVLIFNCSSEKAATEAMEKLKKGTDWKEMLEISSGNMQGDSGRFELSQIAIDSSEKKMPVENSYSAIIKSNDGTASFIKYIKIYPGNQQRSYEEARGLVINDYQNVLEKKWLDSLNKKYPVVINETIVKKILHP